MPEPSKASEEPQPFPWKRYAILGGKILILILVLAGIGHAVVKSLDEFRRQEFSFAQVNLGWFAASGLFYLLGMAPACFFWHRTLQAMGQRPTLWESLRAFYVSQLGKYVPGKAMVVVLRSAAVASNRVDPVVAAISVFVETLTMMAVGACLAAAILVAMFRENIQLTLLAVGLMVVAGTPTFPPLFRKVVRMLRVKKANPKVDEALGGVTFRLMAEGWAIDAIGWCVMGLSLWCALRAMPGLETPLSEPRNVLLLIACVALANVAGFLSLLPAGVGVRDWVVGALVGLQFGPVAAIVSAVLLRLASLIFEVGFSGMLYLWKPPKPTAEVQGNDN